MGAEVTADSERRGLYITPQQIEVGIAYGNVAMRMRNDEVEALLPALDLLIRLTPSEARDLAERLRRKADEAEAQPPQA